MLMFMQHKIILIIFYLIGKTFNNVFYENGDCSNIISLTLHIGAIAVY